MPNIRKPNNVHHISGTYRKDRHGDLGSTLDDKSLPSIPEPPPFMNEIGATEWRRVVGILEPYGLLKATDYGVLIAYCTLFSDIAMASARGNDLNASTYAQFRGYCNDLGLTPVARCKVKLDTGGESQTDNPYGEF